jgi:hypothetical protein
MLQSETLSQKEKELSNMVEAWSPSTKEAEIRASYVEGQTRLHNYIRRKWWFIRVILTTQKQRLGSSWL